MNPLRFIIPAIVGILVLLAQCPDFTEFLKHVVSQYLMPYEGVYLKSLKLVKFISPPLCSSGITFLIFYWIEKRKMKRRFRHSLMALGIIRKAMRKRVTSKSPNEDKKMDRYLQSPLEFAKETVEGNAVPAFKPDDPSQDVMFDPKVKYIVAITAENPNLWMDPTCCFYMANCYAVSLMNQANKAINQAYKVNKRIKRIVVKNRAELKDQIKSMEKHIIDKLSCGERIEDFELIRFFMFTEAQKESCENAVFPSLKAAQDLFRTHSFYINKGCMQNDKTQSDDWKAFSVVVTRLWSLFENTAFNSEGAKKVLANRKTMIIPEFLLLYYANKVEIRSYLDGNPVNVEIYNNTKYKELINKCDYCEAEVRNDIDKLVSLLASYVKNKEYQDDLTFVNNTNMVNNNNTFIDWELEPAPWKNLWAFRFLRR